MRGDSESPITGYGFVTGSTIEGCPPKCPLLHVISVTRLVAVHLMLLLSLLLVFMRTGSAFQVLRSMTFIGTGSTCPFGRMLSNLRLRSTDNSNSRYGGRYGEGVFGRQCRTKRKVTG